MDFAQAYSEFTGFAINDANVARIYAAIQQTTSILEDLLGYTLEEENRAINYVTSLTPTFAYRIFPIRQNDRFHHIDPATEIYDVKVLKNGAVSDTLDSDEWVGRNDRGYMKYFIINQANILNYEWYPFAKLALCGADDLYEFAVDAKYVFEEDKFPNDLMGVLADMITYYSKTNRDIKSETLGSHSYTKFNEKQPEQKDQNRRILVRYAGPRGTINSNPTF